MDRLSEAQQRLKMELDKYNDALESPFPTPDFNSTPQLELIFEAVFKKKRVNAKVDPGQLLKVALADVLLLLDNFDIKQR